MSEQKQPPEHPMMTITNSGWIVVDDMKNDQVILVPDEAISLGLALMETGLFLKQKRKDEENAKP